MAVGFLIGARSAVQVEQLLVQLEPNRVVAIDRRVQQVAVVAGLRALQGRVEPHRERLQPRGQADGPFQHGFELVMEHREPDHRAWRASVELPARQELAEFLDRFADTAD
jgi:hypothetical protein